MQVAQYTFQSPSPSQVQVGKLDTSTKQNQESQSFMNSTNETATKAQAFVATQTKDVTPTVNSNQLLDVYA